MEEGEQDMDFEYTADQQEKIGSSSAIHRPTTTSNPQDNSAPQSHGAKKKSAKTVSGPAAAGGKRPRATVTRRQIRKAVKIATAALQAGKAAEATNQHSTISQQEWAEAISQSKSTNQSDWLYLGIESNGPAGGQETSTPAHMTAPVSGWEQSPYDPSLQAASMSVPQYPGVPSHMPPPVGTHAGVWYSDAQCYDYGSYSYQYSTPVALPSALTVSSAGHPPSAESWGGGSGAAKAMPPGSEPGVFPPAPPPPPPRANSGDHGPAPAPDAVYWTWYNHPETTRGSAPPATSSVPSLISLPMVAKPSDPSLGTGGAAVGLRSAVQLGNISSTPPMASHFIPPNSSGAEFAPVGGQFYDVPQTGGDSYWPPSATETASSVSKQSRNQSSHEHVTMAPAFDHPSPPPEYPVTWGPPAQEATGYGEANWISPDGGFSSESWNHAPSTSVPPPPLMSVSVSAPLDPMLMTMGGAGINYPEDPQSYDQPESEWISYPPPSATMASQGSQTLNSSGDAPGRLSSDGSDHGLSKSATPPSLMSMSISDPQPSGPSDITGVACQTADLSAHTPASSRPSATNRMKLGQGIRQLQAVSRYKASKASTKASQSTQTLNSTPDDEMPMPMVGTTFQPRRPPPHLCPTLKLSTPPVRDISKLPPPKLLIFNCPKKEPANPEPVKLLTEQKTQLKPTLGTKSKSTGVAQTTAVDAVSSAAVFKPPPPSRMNFSVGPPGSGGGGGGPRWNNSGKKLGMEKEAALPEKPTVSEDETNRSVKPDIPDSSASTSGAQSAPVSKMVSNLEESANVVVNTEPETTTLAGSTDKSDESDYISTAAAPTSEKAGTAVEPSAAVPIPATISRYLEFFQSLAKRMNDTTGNEANTTASLKTSCQTLEKEKLQIAKSNDDAGSAMDAVATPRLDEPKSPKDPGLKKFLEEARKDPTSSSYKGRNYRKANHEDNPQAASSKERPSDSPGKKPREFDPFAPDNFITCPADVEDIPIVPSERFASTDTYFSLRELSETFQIGRNAPQHRLFYSSRLPNLAYKPFYSTWTPWHMRWLQDKFSMSMKHLNWVQDLLNKAQVPLKRPLKPVHFVDWPLTDEKLPPMLIKALLGKTLKVGSKDARLTPGSFTLIAYPERELTEVPLCYYPHRQRQDGTTGSTPGEEVRYLSSPQRGGDLPNKSVEGRRPVSPTAEEESLKALAAFVDAEMSGEKRSSVKDPVKSSDPTVSLTSGVDLLAEAELLLKDALDNVRSEQNAPVTTLPELLTEIEGPNMNTVFSEPSAARENAIERAVPPPTGTHELKRPSFEPDAEKLEKDNPDDDAETSKKKSFHGKNWKEVKARKLVTSFGKSGKRTSSLEKTRNKQSSHSVESGKRIPVRPLITSFAAATKIPGLDSSCRDFAESTMPCAAAADDEVRVVNNVMGSSKNESVAENSTSPVRGHDSNGKAQNICSVSGNKDTSGLSESNPSPSKISSTRTIGNIAPRATVLSRDQRTAGGLSHITLNVHAGQPAAARNSSGPSLHEGLSVQQQSDTTESIGQEIPISASTVMTDGVSLEQAAPADADELQGTSSTLTSSSLTHGESTTLNKSVAKPQQKPAVVIAPSADYNTVTPSVDKSIPAESAATDTSPCFEQVWPLGDANCTKVEVGERMVIVPASIGLPEKTGFANRSGSGTSSGKNAGGDQLWDWFLLISANNGAALGGWTGVRELLLKKLPEGIAEFRLAQLVKRHICTVNLPGAPSVIADGATLDGAIFNALVMLFGETRLVQIFLFLGIGASATFPDVPRARKMRTRQKEALQRLVKYFDSSFFSGRLLPDDNNDEDKNLLLQGFRDFPAMCEDFATAAVKSTRGKPQTSTGSSVGPSPGPDFHASLVLYDHPARAVSSSEALAYYLCFRQLLALHEMTDPFAPYVDMFRRWEPKFCEVVPPFPLPSGMGALNDEAKLANGRSVSAVKTMKARSMITSFGKSAPKRSKIKDMPESEEDKQLSSLISESRSAVKAIEEKYRKKQKLTSAKATAKRAKIQGSEPNSPHTRSGTPQPGDVPILGNRISATSDRADLPVCDTASTSDTVDDLNVVDMDQDESGAEDQKQAPTSTKSADLSDPHGTLHGGTGTKQAAMGSEEGQMRAKNVPGFRRKTCMSSIVQNANEERARMRYAKAQSSSSSSRSQMGMTSGIPFKRVKKLFGQVKAARDAEPTANAASLKLQGNQKRSEEITRGSLARNDLRNRSAGGRQAISLLKRGPHSVSSSSMDGRALPTPGTKVSSNNRNYSTSGVVDATLEPSSNQTGIAGQSNSSNTDPATRRTHSKVSLHRFSQGRKRSAADSPSPNQQNSVAKTNPRRRAGIRAENDGGYHTREEDLESARLDETLTNHSPGSISSNVASFGASRRVQNTNVDRGMSDNIYTKRHHSTSSTSLSNSSHPIEPQQLQQLAADQNTGPVNAPSSFTQPQSPTSDALLDFIREELANLGYCLEYTRNGHINEAFVAIGNKKLGLLGSATGRTFFLAFFNTLHILISQNPSKTDDVQFCAMRLASRYLGCFGISIEDVLDALMNILLSQSNSFAVVHWLRTVAPKENRYFAEGGPRGVYLGLLNMHNKCYLVVPFLCLGHSVRDLHITELVEFIDRQLAQLNFSPQSSTRDSNATTNVGSGCIRSQDDRILNPATASIPLHSHVLPAQQPGIQNHYQPALSQGELINPSGSNYVENEPANISPPAEVRKSGFTIAVEYLMRWLRVFQENKRSFHFLSRWMGQYHYVCMVYAAGWQPDLLNPIFDQIDRDRDFAGFFSAFFKAMDAWHQFISRSKADHDEFSTFTVSVGSFESLAGICPSWQDVLRAPEDLGYIVESGLGGFWNSATYFVHRQEPCGFALDLYILNDWCFADMKCFVLQESSHSPMLKNLDPLLAEIFDPKSIGVTDTFLKNGPRRRKLVEWIVDAWSRNPRENGPVLPSPIDFKDPFWQPNRAHRAIERLCTRNVEGVSDYLRFAHEQNGDASAKYTDGVPGQFFLEFFLSTFADKILTNKVSAANEILRGCAYSNFVHKFQFLLQSTSTVDLDIKTLVALDTAKPGLLCGLTALISNEAGGDFSFVLKYVAQMFQDHVKNWKKGLTAVESKTRMSDHMVDRVNEIPKPVLQSPKKSVFAVLEPSAFSMDNAEALTDFRDLSSLNVPSNVRHSAPSDRTSRSDPLNTRSADKPKSVVDHFFESRNDWGSASVLSSDTNHAGSSMMQSNEESSGRSTYRDTGTSEAGSWSRTSRLADDADARNRSPDSRRDLAGTSSRKSGTRTPQSTSQSRSHHGSTPPPRQHHHPESKGGSRDTKTEGSGDSKKREGSRDSRNCRNHHDSKSHKGSSVTRGSHNRRNDERTSDRRQDRDINLVKTPHRLSRDRRRQDKSSHGSPSSTRKTYDSDSRGKDKGKNSRDRATRHPSPVAQTSEFQDLQASVAADGGEFSPAHGEEEDFMVFDEVSENGDEEAEFEFEVVDDCNDEDAGLNDDFLSSLTSAIDDALHTD